MIDAGRLIAAAFVAAVVIGLPGAALARIFRLERRDSIVVGLAVLPLLDALVARACGLDAALVATLALAAGGAVLLIADARKARLPAVPWQGLALCAAWLALVVFESVDLDIAGRLYQPLTVIDTVKHAATTQAIVDTGVPPHDPFFLRPQRVSYYYMFYMLSALVERLGLGLVDARAAFGGCVVWTGFALYGLVRLALNRAGYAEASGRRLLIVALLAAGGLDILGVLRLGFLQGTWLADPAAWNEQVTNLFESLVWVPHHVAGLVAGMLGLMTLAALCAPSVDKDTRARGLVLAGLCFASTLGLSVWLALVLVATAMLWGLVLLFERRWHAIANLMLAGAFALILDTPHMVDLVAGREGSPAAAIALTVRVFSPLDHFFAPGPVQLVARFVALPINYFAGFGVLFAGALFYWETRDRDARKPEFARVLIAAAVAGLVLGTFFKSTLFNNDLGWRVMLFPQLVALILTLAALARVGSGATARRVPALFVILLVAGWATTTYAVFGLRFYPWFANQPAFVAADPETEAALRVAYGWADAHLPTGAVLQHNPTRRRAFAFALYGRHPVSVADSYGSLFGADTRRVDERLAALAPIFLQSLTPSQVRARALANGVDYLVMTAADPVWLEPKSVLWRAAPAFASARVRIIPVAALADVPDAVAAVQQHASEPSTGQGE